MKAMLLAAAACLLLLPMLLPAAEPTEMREWHATSGHKVEARALQMAEGQVQFERADGTKMVVALDKLTAGDQATLRKHFGVEEEPAADEEAEEEPAGEAADDLPYPLGETTAEISCGGDFHYYLYFPKTLLRGASHPVVFVMNPGGGGPGTVKRYQAGAERNRWIIAVSKESKNGFDGSQDAVDAMIKHVISTLAINEKRMYTSGFSGGSRMAFSTSEKHKEIAGVIACGAGGNLGGGKQVAYGLCGTNCFNRTDMANSFKGFRSKECVLRYFPGQHVWANDELCDDAITHLNGVFLAERERDYPEELAHYVRQVATLVEQCADSAPMRAFMWTSFLDEHDILPDRLKETHGSLGEDPNNQLYVKGLTEVAEFAQKQFGDISASQWKADPKISAACLREAPKYAGTPWEEVLEMMSSDAQKF